MTGKYHMIWMMVAVLGVVPMAVEAGGKLQLTCMAPVGGGRGVPAVYELNSKGELVLNGRAISTFKMAELARVPGPQGTLTSHVQHRWLIPDSQLERKVIWRDTKGNERSSMLQVFDFTRQQLVVDGQEVCHHASYQPASPAAAVGAVHPSMEMLTEIYRHYVGKNSAGIDRSSPTINRYFTPETAALILADIREAERNQEVGTLDFDIFVNGQDYEMAKMPEMKLVTQTPDAVTVVALAVNDMAPKGQGDIRFDFKLTAAGWRIADINWPDFDPSLLDLLKHSQ